MSAAVEQLIEQLLAELAVQRVTVRVDEPGGVPGALRGARPGRREPARRHDGPDQQPVPRVLAEHGGQVVQEDAAAEFPGDAAFHECASASAECVPRSSTGCYRDGELVALLSIHDLHAPPASGTPSGALPRRGDRDRGDAR